jgi:restriction system protein
MAGSGMVGRLAVAAAKIPWFVSLGLAAASVAILHIAASAAPLLGLFQFIIPGALLLLALLSLWNRVRSHRLIELLSSGQFSAAFDSLSWPDFERIVGEAFRRRGFRVEQVRPGQAEPGFDMEMTRDGERFFAQCKHWRARHVGIVPVRELYVAMEARGAAGGFVVTSGSFSPEARSFAEGRNVELIDGSHLNSMLNADSDDSCDTQRVAIVRAIEAERLLEGEASPSRRPASGENARIRRVRAD